MYEDKRIEDVVQAETSLPVVKNSDEALCKQRAAELEKILVNDCLPEGFFIGEDGWLYYEEKKNEENPICIRVCSNLKVIARTRDQYGQNHGRLLEFPDPDDLLHQWPMPMELLAGDGSEYRRELLSKGLMIAPGRYPRSYLTTFIQESKPAQTARCVEHTGWNKDRSAFVFHHCTLGNSGEEPLILQAKGDLQTTQSLSGTLADWQESSTLCIGNSRLILAMSAGFSAPLLYLLGLENGGVHFRGSSSSGKTTCLRVAASIWGGPDYMQQWRATSNGLEGAAAAHNDCLLCLDEIGQIDPFEVGKVAYMLANGVGKNRADKLGNSRKRVFFRLIFLSSGEISLNDHMQEAKQRCRAGQEIRVLDIPADGQKFGCFEDIHDSENPKLFAEKLTSLCKTYYGSPGFEFVRHLLSNPGCVLPMLRNLLSILERKYLPSEASSQVARAFNRFALLAAAGELATKFGITKWPEGTAISGAMRCFHDWRQARGDDGPQEERVILEQVRHFFEQHGESRFSQWTNDPANPLSKTQKRTGFRRIETDGEEFYVFAESFKRDICEGLDPRLVAQVCLKHKWLIPDPKGGATRSERLPGIKGNTRIYRFSALVLSEKEIKADEPDNLFVPDVTT